MGLQRNMEMVTGNLNEKDKGTPCSVVVGVSNVEDGLRCGIALSI